MPKNKLFDDNDSDDDNVSFAPKGEYAKKYDTWREKEELHKLEQKYGDKGLDPNASASSDSSDDEPLEVSEEMEEQFLKTLSLLKTQDPRIYDPEYKFFNEKEEKEKETEAVESKTNPKKKVNSLAAAFADSDDDDDDDNEGEIFQVEKKAPLPTTSKEDKLKKYLTGKAVEVEESVQQDLAPLKALWSDPKLSENEAFLRDYILNKRYLDGGGGAPASDKLLDDAALEADEELVEEQGKFERAYNFRFEEPDHEYLKRYPRTMSSIRPKDERRTRKRVEVRTRKDDEKQRKMDDIARLKAMKLRQIQEKIARIKEVTGNDELGFKDEDIEGDFDPAEHDRRMRAIFDEQYYGEADEEKPVFPDLDEELEIENWEKFEQGDEGGRGAAPAEGEPPHCEDEEFNMDADYDPKQARSTLLEEIQETLGKKRRNRRNKSKLARLLSKEKPTFIPQEAGKSYEEYMEEYYAMDCEDVIGGDLPTRFKYRQTVANDFGLTVEEILLADDKELNSWASLKKAVKYRPEGVERGEVGTYRRRAGDEALKRRLLPSLYRELPQEPEIVVPVDTKKNKKKQKNSSAAMEEDGNKKISDDKHNEAVAEENKTETPKKKNKKKKNKSLVNVAEKSSPEMSNYLEDITDKDTDLVNASKVSERANESKKARKKKKKVTQSMQNINLILDSNVNKKPNKERKSGGHTQGDGDKANSLKRKLDSDTNTDKIPPQKKRKNKHNKQTENANVQNAETGVKKKNGAIKQNFVTKKTDDGNKNNATKNWNNVGKNKNNKNKNNAGKNKNSDGKVQNGGVKKEFKNKRKGPFKNNKDSPSKGPVNPLSNLSDERLKAYGLNPKKYRNFLKHKKF